MRARRRCSIAGDIPVLETERFFKECEVLVSQPARLIAHVLEVIEDALQADNCTGIDEVMAKADLTRLGGDFALAVLTMTFPSRTRFPSRSAFYVRTRDRLIGEGEVATDVLFGLE